MTRRGKFIVIEGIEGVGKSTQLRRLSEHLTALGVEHICTREPGGTPVAEQIRDIFLSDHEQERLTAWSEVLLVFAARAQHIETCIEPALVQGKWVLCDRFTDASCAYQGAGRGLGVDTVEALEALVLNRFKPDKVVLLHMPVADALARLLARTKRDRMDQESIEFYERVQAAYFDRAQKHPQRYLLIDASEPEAIVSKRLMQVLLTVYF